ncbi:hypothetical protein H8S95_16585 [Pontibacter sp. KCTC 32443]|uniref:hypothetical protein n=1 Tax=Pontibacter TaxID=323449 RepID=UPI00164D14CC|nr:MULTISPECIES: hypothetical protein [Pontibacter]MBC5775697.1 hypothetical protein [Pontibacter sp. KCTC 32443]
MQQPNRGGFRAPQGPTPGTIRTKKYQLDKDMFTKVALGKVWRREWWYALIPFVLLMLPAVFSFSWWWVVAAVIVTLLFIALRSAQIVGVTRVEQGNVLFEKLTYDIDSRQIIMKRNEREGMTMTWDMIEKAERSDDAFLLWLQPPTASQLPGGWKGWLARTFQAPVFLHLPYRIFVGANDVKLMESLLRRKNLLA